MHREEREVDFIEIEPFVEEIDNTAETPAGTADLKSGKEERKDEKKPVRVKEFIDGSILVRETMTRQLPFVLFLTVLAVLYIGNRYHAESMVRKINEVEMEVKNLRAEQITTAAELMNISKPSQVSASVAERNLGLKQSVEPPKKLIRKKGL